MSIVLDGTGTISGVVAGGLPDATITQADLASGVAGTGPIFSARPTTAQSITSSTWTKINFGTENYDSASCYDTSTSIFTPNVAGYYQISLVFSVTTNVTILGVLLRKNNADFRYGSVITVASAYFCSATWSGLVYLNGTTDYIDVYGYATGTSPQVGNTTTNNVFEGLLVRAT